MEISLLVLVGIALATMFFGYFFGLLEGRGQGYKKGKKEEAEARRGLPITSAVTGPAPTSEERRSLLELGLSESGQPRLHVDGREVDALGASAAQRRRLIDLMVMLKPWVEPGSTPGLVPPSPSASRPATLDRPGPAPARAASSAAPTQAPTPAPAATPIAIAQMSLVTQIDSILQGRIAGTPLAARAIRLAESLHGGAIVFVGSTQYDGVDKVPDPEIQSAIRAAIAEWEKKYTPG